MEGLEESRDSNEQFDKSPVYYVLSDFSEWYWTSDGRLVPFDDADEEEWEKQSNDPPSPGYPKLARRKTNVENETALEAIRAQGRPSEPSHIGGQQETGRPRQETPVERAEREAREAERLAILKKEHGERQATLDADLALSKEKGLALADRIFKSSEMSKRFTPELIRELALRHPTMRRLVGRGTPHELAPKMRSAFRELATQPSAFARVWVRFEALTSYLDNTYAQTTNEINATCRSYGINPKKFTEIMKNPKAADKPAAFKKEIRSTYGFWKKAAWIGSFGAACSGRRRGRALDQALSRKYTEGESTLNQLTSNLVAALPISRIENAPRERPGQQTEIPPAGSNYYNYITRPYEPRRPRGFARPAQAQNRQQQNTQAEKRNRRVENRNSNSRQA